MRFKYTICLTCLLDRLRSRKNIWIVCRFTVKRSELKFTGALKKKKLLRRNQQVVTKQHSNARRVIKEKFTLFVLIGVKTFDGSLPLKSTEPLSRVNN